MPGTMKSNGVKDGKKAGEGKSSRQVEMKTAAPVGRDRKSGRQRGGGAGGSRVKSKVARQVSIRGMSLVVAAREYVWLWDLRHGISREMIASREGLSLRRVNAGLLRAQAQERGDVDDNAAWLGVNGIRTLRLIPMFPIGPYTPQSACRHRQAIASGSRFCCMVCHCSGVDKHPALRRDPGTDPAPEPKAPPPPKKPARETRKVRARGSSQTRP